MSLNVGQSMTAMARRGEKVAKKKGGVAKRINVVVMHEDDDMAGTKRDDGGMPIPAENEMEYRGSQERTR